MSSIKLAEISSSAAYFSPSENADAHVIVIEVKDYHAGVSTSNGVKNQAIADVTSFASAEDLEAGNGKFQAGLKFEQTVLSRELSDKVGEILAVTVRQLAGRNGNKGAWVFDRVAPAVSTKVVAYLEEREKAQADILGDLLA